VLVVDPDPESAASAVAGLRRLGLDAQGEGDVRAALRTLGSLRSDVLVLALAAEDSHGFLRRLRDDFMGARPQVVVVARAEAVTRALADLGVDAVVLAPADPAALARAAGDVAGGGDPGWETRLLRELVRSSLVARDLDAAVHTLAERLALAFGATECLVAADLGRRSVAASARGMDIELAGPQLQALIRASLDAGAPVLAGDGGGGQSCLAVPIDSLTGITLGALVVLDAPPRVYPAAVREHLAALCRRLHAELTALAIQERIHQENAELREKSTLDSMLPGVLNRAALEQAVEIAAAAGRERGEPVTLAMMDLRGLRRLNEQHGHVVGDEALAHVAMVIKRAVGAGDLLGRYAGDKLVLLFARTPLAEARGMVERIQVDLAGQPLVRGDERIVLALAVGLTAQLGPDDTAEALLLRGLAASAAAKKRLPPQAPLVVADSESWQEGVASLPAASLVPGSILGGTYRIVHEISAGGVGLVYRAEDLSLGRPVAIKSLRPDLGADVTLVRRLHSEAMTLASLRHENLVQVYSFGSDADGAYFVMELVEGETLDERIERARADRKHIEVDDVERWLTQVASALDAMHQAGVLHRDVKPGNIVVDRVRGRAVLVDLGIAKPRGSKADPAGTPGYMAPETLWQSASEGPTADVYGLAATAYTLLTCLAPFGEGNPDLVIRRQAARPDAPGQFRPGLPRAVDATIGRSLDPVPERRHASAGAFVDALRAALAAAPDEVRRAADPLHPLALTLGLGEASTPPGAQPLALAPPLPPSAVAESIAVEPTAPAPLPGRSRSTARRLRQGWKSTLVLAGKEAAPPAHQSRGVFLAALHRVLSPGERADWVAHVGRNHPVLARALQEPPPPMSWLPTELLVSALRSLGEAGLDGPVCARLIGQTAAASSFTRFLGADPGALTPQQVIGLIATLWERYHDWGEVTVEWRSETEVDVAVADGVADPLLCASSAGLLGQVASVAGISAHRVIHTACASSGASACEFTIRWPRPTPP